MHWLPLTATKSGALFTEKAHLLTNSQDSSLNVSVLKRMWQFADPQNRPVPYLKTGNTIQSPFGASYSFSEAPFLLAQHGPGVAGTMGVKGLLNCPHRQQLCWITIGFQILDLHAPDAVLCRH